MEQTITGALISASGGTDLGGVAVWFAYKPLEGKAITVETVADSRGRFTFKLPPSPLENARIGALSEGVTPVDLEPNGIMLEPGDVVLIVDDIAPPHLRYGGLA